MPACAALAAAGCAAAPPPPPAPVPVAPAPPPPPPDITAVPTPTNLVFFARIKDTAASMKVATDWARLPSLDAGALMEGFLDGALQGKGHAKLASVLDTGQPVDFAASFELKLPPKGLFAFAAAVTSLDATKAALAATYDERVGEGGVIRLEPRTDPAKGGAAASDDADDTSACELAPSAGAAPYRLVCGSSVAALAALGPYLARTTPRRTLPADLHVEMRAAPLAGFATLARLQGLGLISSLLGLDPGAQPATNELVTAAIGDLFDYVGDLDVMTLDAALEPAQAGLTFRTTFKSATSLLAQLSTAHPERADVPPDAFWRLPGDVDVASFGSGVDEADIRHPRDLVVAALNEQLEKQKVGDADRRALTGTVKELLRGTGGVVAHGEVDAASLWLMERDDPPALTTKLLKDLVALWSRPGFAKWAKTDGKAAAPPPTLKLGPPIAGLPAGSLHVVITTPPDAPVSPSAKPGDAHAPRGPGPRGLASAVHAPPPAAEVYHLVVVPDGARSWLALSKSTPALRSTLAAVLAHSPRPDALGARAHDRGLDGFKETRMTSGGFVTVRAFVELARAAVAERHGVDARRWDAVLAHLPAKGVTPIVMTAAPGSPTADDPGGVRDLHVTIPADAIRDAVWFGLQADQLKGN